MNSRATIQELIEARHSELTQRAEELRSQLKLVESELEAVLAAAKAVALDLSNKKIVDWQSQPVELSIKATSPLTMKSAALKILDGVPGGLTSSEILDAMSDRFGMKYPRSSLSPQLSRLRYEGSVSRHKGRWLLSRYSDNFAEEEPKKAPS